MAKRERKQDTLDFTGWDLNKLLRHARTWFDSNEKSIVEVMRQISGIDVWTRSKCEKFLTSMIEEFVDRKEDKPQHIFPVLYRLSGNDQ